MLKIRHKIQNHAVKKRMWCDKDGGEKRSKHPVMLAIKSETRHLILQVTRFSLSLLGTLP